MVIESIRNDQIELDSQAEFMIKDPSNQDNILNKKLDYQWNTPEKNNQIAMNWSDAIDIAIPTLSVLTVTLPLFFIDDGY